VGGEGGRVSSWAKAGLKINRLKIKRSKTKFQFILLFLLLIALNILTEYPEDIKNKNH
jgi:hypothetical protein